MSAFLLSYSFQACLCIAKGRISRAGIPFQTTTLSLPAIRLDDVARRAKNFRFRFFYSSFRPLICDGLDWWDGWFIRSD
jgi:hypothetical protein